MRVDLASYERVQVFLNFPFDTEFEAMAHAMHFGVVAAGFIPVCARDLTAPDRPRLEVLVEAISSCQYSAHDFSRYTGEGANNYARFNMPIEMGMALFYALRVQRAKHRCAFFVPTPHDYQAFASDLAGLDPKVYNGNEHLLAALVYEWLRDVGKPMVNEIPTVRVREKYGEFRQTLLKLQGSGSDGRPSHDEAQELMYQICSDCRWWVWRENPLGRIEFPLVPLAFVSP